MTVERTVDDERAAANDVRARRLISFVIPAYNEEACIDELAARLRTVFASLAERYDFEVIVIENGSHDRTYEKLLFIRDVDPRFKILKLSRNFGPEAAVISGLRYAAGDAAILMYADLQDPPDLIPKFLEQWEAGYENVFGVITRRTDESRLRQFFTRSFYYIINKLSDTPVPRNVSDFRLVDRKAYEALGNLPERNGMLRTMWGWIGFKSIGIEHTRAPRFGGRSSYKFFKTFGYAIRGILMSSSLPLKVIPVFGLILSALTFLIMFASVIRTVFFGVPFNGFGTIVGLMLLLFGFLFMLLGVVAEYIGMIYDEVRRRPLVVVDTLHGLSRRENRINPERDGELHSRAKY
jgi:dolichol-phosphate mannosyltransferase